VGDGGRGRGCPSGPESSQGGGGRLTGIYNGKFGQKEEEREGGRTRKASYLPVEVDVPIGTKRDLEAMPSKVPTPSVGERMVFL